MADSIISSQFEISKIITYKNDNTKSINKLSIIGTIVNILSEMEESDNNYKIILTLNQVTDNPEIITHQYETETICELFNLNKLLVSKYKNFEIIEYILDRLASALKIIYSSDENKNEDSELKFVSSLFPMLKVGSFTRLKTKKIKLCIMLFE